MANMKSIKKRVDALAREKREREMAQRDRDKLCELVNDIKRDAVKYVLDHCVSANPDRED
jgi:hypothetical protein